MISIGLASRPLLPQQAGKQLWDDPEFLRKLAFQLEDVLDKPGGKPVQMVRQLATVTKHALFSLADKIEWEDGCCASS